MSTRLPTARRAFAPPRLAVALLVILVVVPAVGATAVARAQEPVEVTVALDWYPNANHAGLFLAQARGYFTDEGLEVELTTPADPTTVLQTVGSGQDTFGLSYQTDLLLARAQEIPVVSIAAIAQRPLMGVMSLSSAGITKPSDLVGKTVGYPGIPSQEAFLATMLEADGASLDDVSLVDVGFNLIPAVVSGRTDAVMGAYWTHETLLAERDGHSVDLLRVEEWGVPPYYELVLVAGESTLADNPELASAFLRAMQRGYAEAIADPQGALDVLEATSPDLEREVEAEGLALLAPVWTEGGAIGVQDPARWRDYAAWMVERRLIPADLAIEDAYTTEFVPLGATPVASPAPPAG